MSKGDGSKTARFHTGLIVGAVIGAIGLLLLPFLELHGTWWGRVLMAVSQAAVVAGILGITVVPFVQKAATESAVDSAMEDAASYILTYDLPRDEASDAINYISRRKLIRRNLSLKYVFSGYEKEGRLLVRPQWSFSMENCTPFEQTYNFNLRVAGGAAEHGGVEFIWARGEDLDHEVKLTKDQLTEREGVQENFKVSSNAGNLKNQFEVRTAHILPDTHEDVFFHLEPTLGVTVVVEDEPDLDLQANVNIGTFYPERVAEPSGVGVFPREWKLDGTLVLPGQAISIEWELSGA